jgi:hypothetical protein
MAKARPVVLSTFMPFTRVSLLPSLLYCIAYWLLAIAERA